MLLTQLIVSSAYQLAVLLLTVYGCYVLLSVLLYFLSRPRHDWPATSTLPAEWPRVTVQLPIYNEPYVAGRLLQAAADLDYPADRLQIQVLDDSRDRTSPQVANLVARLVEQRGLNITHVRRQDRRGYKAGALAEALPAATGDFVAVFDADFVPTPDWLRLTVPSLLAHPEMAFVQTRWDHLNRDQNLLTAAQGLALDGHFVIEQQARSAAGIWQNFNGSGGLWRRSAIDAAGGWTADTVTEDLDLSYRAQLQGWRGGYLTRVRAPGELPSLLTSFKRQQRRWAKGSMQTLRKLARPVLTSTKPLTRRLYALAHLAGYAVNLPLLALLALTLPLALLPAQNLPLPGLGVFSMVVSLAPILLYGLAQQQLSGRGGWRRMWALPVLALLTLGLSPSLGLSVVEGATRKGGEFSRTPKYGRQEGRLPFLEEVEWRSMLPEMVTFLFAAVTLATAVMQQRWNLLLLPLFYTVGCGLVLALGWHEHRQVRSQVSVAGRTGDLELRMADGGTGAAGGG